LLAILLFRASWREVSLCFLFQRWERIETD
jgi:hypothetical protein